jgi:hypothetical protein
MSANQSASWALVTKLNFGSVIKITNIDEVHKKKIPVNSLSIFPNG